MTTVLSCSVNMATVRPREREKGRERKLEADSKGQNEKETDKTSYCVKECVYKANPDSMHTFGG